MNDDFKFTGARYFLNIPSEVGEDPRLHDKSKLIFGQIFAMLNVTGSFYMSNKEIAKRVNAKSVSTVKNCLAELEEYGYIKRKNIYKGKEIVGRQITSDWNPWSKKCPTPSAKKMPQGNKMPDGRAIKCPLKEHLNRDDDENKKAKIKIYDQLIELSTFNDGKTIKPENTLKAQALKKMVDECSLDLLCRVRDSFETQLCTKEIREPFSYLLTIMGNALDSDKNWRKGYRSTKGDC